MNALRILLFAMFVAAAPAFLAHGHSWYPEECCSNHDCMPADRIETNAYGDRIVFVANRQVWIPRGLSARLSSDGRVHICLRVVATPEADISTIPFCLFVPPQS